MNRCLQAPEILQLICDQLPNGRNSDRQRLLAVALSCRALLEPALDRLWHTIYSIKPMTSILPGDLWTKERKVGPNATKFTVLGLRRAIQSTDLDRYVAYYAQRIRVVDFGPALNRTFSPEAWRGLELATNWKHGALSPSARKIVWTLTPLKQSVLPKEALDQAFPYFSLFLGPKTTCLHVSFDSGVPIHVASIRSAVNIPLELKELKLKDVGNFPTTFMGNYLKSFSWERLKVLRIANLPADAISHLSTLPLLATIEVWAFRKLSRLYTYSAETDIDNPPDHLAAIPDNAFRALQTLELNGNDIESVEAFVQYLPPKNQLRKFKCVLRSNPPNSRGLRDLIVTIRLHCDIRHLKKITIKGGHGLPAVEERLHVQVDEGINLDPLFVFNLESLTINLPSIAVNLNGQDINDMSDSFPNLRKLKIDTDIHDSRIPLIDHKDFLKLLYDFSCLRKLGLRFNATGITGQEQKPNSTYEQVPTPLEKLWVGDSPIYFPPAAADFFKAHAPKLQGLDIITLQIQGPSPPENTPIMLYHRRWNDVQARIIINATDAA
ncbi:hypothetical protein DFP72DRAFT_498877 [Ephemerocybe angulata]|uniref:F-box domain-containing protein n=1 Tax=Ephemerocybe angulata TaxID=980116 RepID=A0A8H6HRN6_9AGAR|nr:hypothetical protein DFP72DRAFT_498877 [Tulosesus angulatus]